MIPIPRIPGHRREHRHRGARAGKPCLREALLGIAGFLLVAAIALYLIVRLAS